MDNFVDERDIDLLEGDKYTFFVLKRLFGGKNTLLLSDHERLIICFSEDPFPVWIWTPDDASEEELERAYILSKENGLMDGEHRFNIKYELAEYFIQRAERDGLTFAVETNMFAYDNPAPIAPGATCEGSLHQCTEEDIDELVEFYDLFRHAIDADYESEEVYRKKAKEGVAHGALYFWKDAEGRSVASCHWFPNNGMAAVGLVYTRPEARRKHYAENLVDRVTTIAKEAGFLPMLYTDADYVASNACYEKIGYILRGKLCTIACKK